MSDRYYDAGLAIIERSEELAVLITERQYQMQPELSSRFGENGRKRTIQDTKYNLKYLSESVQLQSILLFANYITWLRTLLAGYKVTTEEIAINLSCMREVIVKRLEPDHSERIAPYIDHVLRMIRMNDVEDLADSDGAPLDKEAKQYTELLLKGNRHEASELIMQLRERVAIQDIYLHIFQKSQHMIGSLWQTNKINIAQEHYCTAATQMIMSQLYPYIFTTERRGRQLVATCVGEELHEIGLRMVCDFFEMDGWDTYYMGANVPNRSIIETIINTNADVIAISVTMTFHVNLVKELIDEIRRNENCNGVKIMVGGLPFNIEPELWKQVGADAHALQAKDALSQALQLLSPSLAVID